MKFYLTIFSFLIIFVESTFFTSFALAQLDRPLKRAVEITTPPAEFKYIPKKPGHYTAEDWRTVIDSTWGPGLPTNQKLAIFDEAWNTLNAKYAAFQNLNVNWTALRDLYRPEIADTVNPVSRGRFAAIMNHLSLALHELHTGIIDAQITTNKLLIYPNPSHTTITIELPIEPSNNVSLTILNTQGQQLIIQPITEQKTELNISQLPAGIYFVRVNTANAEVNRKLLVN